MAAPLQQMLQSAVQAVQWTYSLFWHVCPQQGILVWGDGYYNGAIKTRKTVQPMEVSPEEASLQRSQQLRELYESLLAEEANQPTRRPCAALSPEDLTESEWFYLMSVSFSFPPGVGLPGKALARQQHVWLTAANEADSKVFSRAILAKSAGVRTVLCIPLMDGVVELGTTERVQEDLGLIQHIRSFFMEHQHQPNPAHSEQSTSNPIITSERTRFKSPPLHTMYPLDPPLNSNQQDDDGDDDDDEDEEEEEEEVEEEEEAAGSDLEPETDRISYPSAAQDPLQLHDPVTQNVEMVEATAEPSELMQIEMSEDIRLGSPDDGSSNLESEMHMLAVRQSSHQADIQRLAESPSQWPFLSNQLSNGLQPPVSGTPQVEELTQEDTHYSQTVSTILQNNSGHWMESSSLLGFIGYSPQSAFYKWSCRNNPLHLQPLDGVSQWVIKYILFTVPFLHNKYRDENSPKSRYIGDMAIPLRKSASQDELSANHVLAERRRREKLNERFVILRSLVPFVTKMDKASILGDTIEYVKQLRRRIQDLESSNRQMDGGDKSRSVGSRSSGGRVVVQDRVGLGPDSERRKMRRVEGRGGGKAKVVDGVPMIGNVVQVSIIECDALIELKCSYRDGLLLEIMQKVGDLLMEITAAQFSSTNGVFVAELRAKVKENSNGKKVTIVEVKRAIHQIIGPY